MLFYSPLKVKTNSKCKVLNEFRSANSMNASWRSTANSTATRLAPRAEYQKPGAYWQARRMRTQMGAKQIAFRDNCHNEEETLEWEGSIQIMADLKTNGCVSLTRKAFLAAALSAVVEYPTCIFPCNIPDKSRLVT